MEIPQRKLTRIAEGILRQLRLLQRGRYREVIQQTRQLIEDLNHFCRLSDLLSACLDRDWNAAAADVTDRIAQNLRDLPYYAGEIQRMVESAKTKLPTIRDILADLRQTEDEFGAFKVVEADQLLVVTTEPIELEGQYLGEFEIQLRVGSLSELRRRSSVYQVVALDPHPAVSNESVTHPHVSDERLCEGDAGAAIAASLANGRICDFFHLVHAVLITYNPHSPYVALDDWEGQPCHDCGYTMHEDNTNWCTSCEEDFCDECSSYCRCCDETTCVGCLSNCEACGDPVCSSCMTTCDECGRSICKSCRDEVLCPCAQENEENEDDAEPDNKPATCGTTSAQEGNQPEGPGGQTPPPVEQAGGAGVDAA